jgi:hypothetical protein
MKLETWSESAQRKLRLEAELQATHCKLPHSFRSQWYLFPRRDPLTGTWLRGHVRLEEEPIAKWVYLRTYNTVVPCCRLVAIRKEVR